jgi:subtilisin family serine protease
MKLRALALTVLLLLAAAATLFFIRATNEPSRPDTGISRIEPSPDVPSPVAPRPTAASPSSVRSSATSPAGSISSRAGQSSSPASPQPGSSPQMASPAPVRYYTDDPQVDDADKSPRMASPATDRYASAEVVAKSETPLGASGKQVRRVRIVRTDSKYPLVRIEETVTRATGAAGADTVTDQKAMVADHLMVKRAPGVTEDAFFKTIATDGGTIREKIRGADSLYLVAFPGEETEALPAAMKKFSTAAAYVEPDYIVHTMLTPNDTSFGQLWGMDNAGMLGAVYGTVTAGGTTLQDLVYAARYTLAAPAPGVTGILYDCGLGLAGQFPASVSGNIALIQRGQTTFAEKASNAKAAGATAVLFYNNVEGVLFPSLGTRDASLPPALGLSLRDGLALKALGSVSATVVIDLSSVDSDIDAPEAWDIHTGDRSILVGVIDTGIDYNHPDLAANMWTNPNEIAGNGIDDDGNGYIDDTRGWDFVNNDNDPMDDHYHGTHCAGTIGGVGNNANGVTGVCWQVSMVGLKFLSKGGGGTISDAVSAVYYANSIGVNLTSNSWGGGGYSEALKDAIDAANDAGMLFIAAAGNNAFDNDVYENYPSSYTSPNVIAVAATDVNDELAPFSNWGATTVDLAAPGVDIYSTQPGNLYQNLSGTSMATPHVAGAVALAWSLSPDSTAAEIKANVLASADPIPSMTGKCVTGGRLNAYKTLTSLGMNVASTTPAERSVVFAPPVEFVVNFNRPYTPATVAASDFTVNGIPADSFVLTDADTVTFAFNSTPAGTEGKHTMAMAAGAVTRLSDAGPLYAWSATFRYDALGLTVASTSPATGSTVSMPFTTLILNFNEAFDPATVSAADFVLSQGSVTGVTVVDSDTVELALANILNEGTLTLTIAAGRIADPLGAPCLAYSGSYEPDYGTITLPAEITPVEPRGSMAFGAIQSGGITTTSDTDGFTIALDAGQILTVLADPSQGLQPSVELRDPSNNVVATATAAGAGQDAVIQAYPIVAPGVFTITVSGAGATTGTYTLRPVINAVLEAENHNGPANDSRAASQNLDAAFILPGGPVATAAVLGETPEDWFSFTLAAGDRLSATLTCTGDSTIELYDGAGALLARGMAGPVNVTEFIDKYAAGSAGTYHARVAGTTGSYALVVTKNAASDLEQNDSHATAQEITGHSAALGAISAGPSLFAVEVERDWTFPVQTRIHRLNPQTGAIIASFDAPAGPHNDPFAMNLAHDGTNLWFNNGWPDLPTIYKLNANTGAVLGSFTHTPDAQTSYAPFGLAYVRGEVFVSDGSKIYAYSASTYQLVRTFDSPIDINWDNFVGFTGDDANNHLYGIAQSDHKIYRLDPANGAVLASSSETSPEGLEQGMAVVGDEIFISEIIEWPIETQNIAVYDRLTFAFKRRMPVALPRWIAGLGGDGAATTDDWLSFRVNTGDTLALATITPAGDPQDPYHIHNTLDPQIELYSPTNTLLASDDNGAADGKNAVLSHTAATAGLYRARVRGMNGTTGEYVLTVTGATGTQPAPQASAVTPANGADLNATPTQITIDFGANILLGSLQASDLTVNGVAATSFTIVDGNTVIFTLPALGEGVHSVAIAPGAILSADGTAFAGFTSQFTVDLTAPRVISTSVQQNDVIPPIGNLTITIQFSERLIQGNIGATDFSLIGTDTGKRAASSFSYNATTSTLTLQYTGLLTEEDLALTLRSADGAFEDLAGNNLDGEAIAFPMPPNQSGDGVAGGDFVLNFSVDHQSGVGTLLAFTAKNPRGSLAYASSESARIAPVGDSDSYSFTLDAGQTLTAAVRPDSTLRPTLSVTGPGGSLGNATATGAGQSAVVQTVTADTAGTYTITVTGASSTAGSYTVEALLNAATELESFHGATNNSTATAQNIDAAALSPAPGASRLAVVGRGDGISSEIMTADSFGYRAAMIAHRFEDISATGKRLVIESDDDGWTVLPTSLTATDLAGFTFPFYGTTYSSLYISSGQGLITFTAGFEDQVVAVKDLKLMPQTPSIALLWNSIHVDDWIGNLDPNTGLFWQVLGSGADRRLVIQWNKVAFTPRIGDVARTPVTFQAVLYASGVIEFNYPDLDFAPNSFNQEGIEACVGIKAAGTQYTKRLLVKQSNLQSPYVGTGKSIRIATGLTNNADHYALSLTAGEKATLVMNGGTNSVLELLNSSGTVVATGVSGPTNLARAILDYTAPSTATYSARVRDTLDAEYTLTALRAGAGFDLEANDTTSTAQDIKPVVFGDTTSGADYYKVLLAPGDTLALRTYTPAVGEGASANNLNPRLDVYDSTDALVASNDNDAPDGRNAVLSYTAATQGFRYIRVSGASGAGEYVLTASYTARTIPSASITGPTAAAVGIPANVGLILEGAVSSNSTPPGAVTATWSKVSGPGTVTFGNAAAANTTAMFSAAGAYVLRITANEGGIQTTRDLSVTVGATPVVWTGGDIGAVAAAGSYTESGGAFTVLGSGANITGSKDEFQYVHLPLTGDGEMIARVASLQNTVSSSLGNAGVMIRETTNSGSRHASMLISSRNTTPPAYLRSRSATAGSTASVTVSGLTVPVWLKIVRTGNTLAGYSSPDGVTWTQQGSNLSITMNASVRIGLAVTSANDGTLCTAVFDNVSTTAGSVNVGASVDAGANATIQSGASATLDAAVTDDGRSTPLTVAWSMASGPGTATFGNATAIDTTATFSAPGDYVLRLTANDGLVKTFDEVTVTVSDTSSPAETWRQTHFGTTANSGNAADSADPDGDGIANLLERALGADPNAASTTGLPVSSTETVGADNFLALTIVKSPAATDVTFAVEVGGDLAIWNSGPDHTTILENTSTLLKVRDNTPMSEATKRFMRLRVTSP